MSGHYGMFDFDTIFKKAIERFTNNVSSAFNEATDNFGDGDILSGLFDVARIIPTTKLQADFLKYGSKAIWKLGAEYYLKPNGYAFSAELLEDALEEKPKPHFYGNNSYVAQLLRSDDRFIEKVKELTETYFKNKLDAKGICSFEKGDLYYSLHTCRMKITDVNRISDKTAEVTVNVTDNYDYTKIWTAMGGRGISLGTIANDAGTVTTKFDALNEFPISINLKVRIEL